MKSGDVLPARQRLVRMTAGVADAFAEKTTIVFDGQRGGKAEEFETSGVEVLYSPSNRTADTVIEQLVCDSEKPDGILVVTADRSERDTVVAAGAQAMSCVQFLENIQATQKDISNDTKRRKTSAKGPTLGDFFP